MSSSAANHGNERSQNSLRHVHGSLGCCRRDSGRDGRDRNAGLACQALGQPATKKNTYTPLHLSWSHEAVAAEEGRHAGQGHLCDLQTPATYEAGLARLWRQEPALFEIEPWLLCLTVTPTSCKPTHCGNCRTRGPGHPLQSCCVLTHAKCSPIQSALQSFAFRSPMENLPQI